MPMNSGSPIIGRLASAGLGFLSSTWGLPVAGLMGSRSHTITPQIPPPHLLTRTLASPAWVNQIPLASPPTCAFAGGAASNAAESAIIMNPNLAAMKSPKKQACIAANAPCAMPYMGMAGGGYLPQCEKRTEAAAQGSPGQAA